MGNKSCSTWNKLTIKARTLMSNNIGKTNPTRAPTQITYQIVKDLTLALTNTFRKPGRLV